MSKKKIGIDIGHGGNDSGCVGLNGTKEKDITLILGLLVDEVLRDYGINTYLTRKTDKYVSLSNRTKGLNMNKCDVAISIHIDAAKDRNANHFGVYIVDNGGKAEVLAGALARDIKAITDWSTGGSSNGVRIGNYHIVRETDMPAVIIECNFLSNPIIEKQLNNKMFQVK